MYWLGLCSKGSWMLRPMVLPPASWAPRLAASIMPGPPPEVTTKRLRQSPRVFVVTRHLHCRHCAFTLQIGCCSFHNLGNAGGLLFARSGLAGTGIVEQFEGVVCLFAAAKACRTEEDHRVLNLFLAEAG